MDLHRQRILVTGADGFIGSHLAELFVKQGADVVALVQYNSFNSWGWLDQSPCAQNMRIEAGDIRDAHYCADLVRDIDVVMHLAALIPIPYSYRAPESYIETNVKGTLNLCQAARASGIKKFVHTSSSEVYGTAQYVPIDEKHPLTPQSPYSASKIGADSIALSFYYSFQLPVVVARPFNTYGPRQSARAVIPTIISQLSAGQREVRLGDLTTTRDFTFVEDTCRGLNAVASLDTGVGEVFHIGSNQEISIRDLFGLIREIMGIDARIVREDVRLRPEKSEVLRLRCDNAKLRDACGYEPAISLADGLTRTVEWFSDKANLQRYKGDLYNV
jgi:NAD dependent epimerase/dehydratase